MATTARKKKTSVTVTVRNSLGRAESAPATLRAIEANRERIRQSGRAVPRAV